MYCIKCGTQINNNDTFCYNCGAMQNRAGLNCDPVQQPVITHVPPTLNQPQNQQYVPHITPQQPIFVVQPQQPVNRVKKPKSVFKTPWFWILCGVASMVITISAISSLLALGSYDDNDYNKDNPFEYSPEDFQEEIENNFK